MQLNANTDSQIKIAVPPRADVQCPTREVCDTRTSRRDTGSQNDMHSQRGDVQKVEEYAAEPQYFTKRRNPRKNGFGEEGSYGAKSVAHDRTDYSRTIRGVQVCNVFPEERPILTSGSRSGMAGTSIKNNSRNPPPHL